MLGYLAFTTPLLILESEVLGPTNRELRVFPQEYREGETLGKLLEEVIWLLVPRAQVPHHPVCLVFQQASLWFFPGGGGDTMLAKGNYSKET